MEITWRRKGQSPLERKNIMTEFNRAEKEIKSFITHQPNNVNLLYTVYKDLNGPNSLKPGQFVKVNNFKIQASGLISRIYGKYFADEKNPLDGSPSTIINTTQTQNQSIKVEIAVEMTELISQKILEHKEGSTERTFLEQIRDGLKTGKNIVELINLILSTGSQLGLTTAAILQLLSK